MKTTFVFAICIFALSHSVLAKNTVKLITEMGDIVIKLNHEKAPLSAGDFLKYTEQGLFEKTGFFRVVRNQNSTTGNSVNLVQGGFIDDKKQLPSIPHESTKQTGLTHKRGAVSLARWKVGTGSAAYFFIMVKDTVLLDHGHGKSEDKQGYAVFGEVIEGMEIIDKIHRIDKSAFTTEGYMKNQKLKEPIKIINAAVIPPFN